MMDANVPVRVCPALRAFVRRVIPELVGARPVARVVLVVAGLVTATSVVGTSDLALATDTSGELAPDELTNVPQPCAPDGTTVTATTTTVPPTESTTTTTVTATTESATESTTTTTTTTTTATAESATESTTTTESVATPSTGSLVETAVVGVGSCVETASDPLGPALPPTLDPTVTTTTPLNGSAQSPETTATAAIAAPAVEAPPVVTNSDAISAPPDMSVSVTATPLDIAPPDIPSPDIAPPDIPPSDSAPPDMAPPVITAPAIALPVTSPAIPVASRTWATGVTRAGAPREPGPSVLRPGRAPAGARVVLADVVEAVLATIRELESGGRYDVGPNRAQASGAYQYIPSTWRHEGGFAHAYLAPREVQDARARADVERVLELYGGDVSMVPVMWYYPRAASDARWMDRVPNPAGGNRLTIREYQARWMERFVRNAHDLLGTYVAAADSPAAVSVLSAFPQRPDHPEDAPPPIGLTAGTARSAGAASVVGAGRLAGAAGSVGALGSVGVGVGKGAGGVPYVLDAVTVSERTVELAARSVPPEAKVEDSAGWMRSIVFPVLGPVAYADGWGDARDGGARRHEGTDIIGVAMQPLLAATDGRITQLRLEPRGRSGVAMSIRDVDGWRYNYFHANNDTPATDDGAADDGFRLAPGLEVGDEVIAGQIIGYLGDSGNAEDSVAHLHFEFRDPLGRAAPSFWSLRAAEARQACTIGIGPWSTPTLSPRLDAGTDVAAQLGADTADTIDSATVERERAVRHTVVTPMYGEGQWVIDSDGRVTATGDAALIIPSRTLECAPGPATPFGTDAAGWASYDHDTLTGTVLDDVELTGTVLDDVEMTGTVLANASLTGTQLGDVIRELSLVESYEPPLEPIVFTDSATGEKIIVTFEPPPHDTTPPPTNTGRPAGTRVALGPSGRREPRRTDDLDATLPHPTVLRI